MTMSKKRNSKGQRPSEPQEISPSEVRAKLGLSIGEFAAKLGVRDYTVERWEKGRSKPSPLAIAAIKGLLLAAGA